jgi:hypothetical protein
MPEASGLFNFTNTNLVKIDAIMAIVLKMGNWDFSSINKATSTTECSMVRSIASARWRLFRHAQRTSVSFRECR